MTKLGICLMAVSLAGCTASSHLTESYGKSFREVWRAQRAGDGIPKAAVKGLDSEEATIIAGSYRQSLAPEETGAADAAEILYVAPPPRGGRGTKLAPSVPKER
ncbi:MAG TPA: hypothetical protein VD838_05985 [Anaeromyxobacteraceae bacterium]|nr:hypothetical protein [Anaeromyxobacteraceae bacterium]